MKRNNALYQFREMPTKAKYTLKRMNLLRNGELNNLIVYLKCKCKAAIRIALRRRGEPSFKHNPLVSVILVTHNSSKHIHELSISLKSQIYDKFELVVVDNDSKDNTVDLVKKCLSGIGKGVTIKELGKNIGFAEGSNLGNQISKGELIALLNADTVPDNMWLLELVNALRLNSWASVATPKLLFCGYFKRISLTFPCKARIRLDLLTSNMSYPKIFMREGNKDQTGKYIISNRYGNISLDIPASCNLLLLKIECTEETEDRGCKAYNSNCLYLQLDTDISHELISLSDQINGEIYYLRIPENLPVFRVINNAGSKSGRLGDNPRDRGYANIDCTYYDQPVRVNRFCGCAPLIRRESVIDRDLFIKQFFAYYEDSELGRWLVKHGRGEIIYWPRSVVQHYHSSTLSEGSATWRALTKRSCIIYRETKSSRQSHSSSRIDLINSQLASIREIAETESVNEELLCILGKQDIEFMRYLKNEKTQNSLCKRDAIGVFNLYWNTRGGGEIHALAIAALLRREYPHKDIYLISETDFDLNALGEYFEISTVGLRKLVVKRMNTNLTKRFWLFINSTSHSSLRSKAKYSWYIVSFPHKSIVTLWLKGYKLLCNSDFTRHYCKARWGAKSAMVVYPVLQLDRYFDGKNDKENKKDKCILNIARFTRRGHAKNQHLIISSFINACEMSFGNNKYWRLNLVGSFDEQNDEDRYYFQELVSQVAESKYKELISLIPNASRGDLEYIKKKSALYIHATGLNAESRRPEHQEHFGIAPVEAALEGCYPLVYKYGGPAEVVSQTGFGQVFESTVEMSQHIINFINKPFAEICTESKKGTLATIEWIKRNQSLPLELLT